jgi:nucleoside-diphosphate-sugar epimerase
MLTPVERSGHINDFYEAKNALVTGGFGFVGSHVVKRLVEYGANVTVLDLRTEPEVESLLNDPALKLRDRVQVCKADITDAAAMSEIIHAGRFHFIYHFAAYGTVIEKAADRPYDTVQANTMGLVNILEAVRQSSFRPNAILFSSTDKVYGEMDGEHYEEEKTPLRGIGVYDAAKLAADVFARTYHDVFDLPTVTLRMCNLFGPHDYNIAYRLVPKAMRNIYGGEQPQAPEMYFDAIEHWRDYLYIEDAVRAILLLTYHPACRGEVYNLMACQYLSTPEMFRTLVHAVHEVEQQHDRDRAENILKNGIAIKVRPGSSHVITIKKQHLNGGKLKKATGFEPATDFKEALVRTVRFYREHFLSNAASKNRTDIQSVLPKEDIRKAAA